MTRTLFLVIALISAALWGAMNWFEKIDAQALSKYASANAAFNFQLSEGACVSDDKLNSAAAKFGFNVESHLGNRRGVLLNAGYTKEQIATTAVVHIEPPMPFAKEQGRSFQFDRDGCLLR